MLNNKPIIKFVLLFSVIYGAFLLTNEVGFIRNGHKSFFASFGEWVYNSWHPSLRADIGTDLTTIGADPSNDYILTAYNKQAYRTVRVHNAQNPMEPKQYEPVAYMAFKARMSHAIATFFLLGLILATPNKWKKKLIGSIVAIYILYILVAMKLTFLLEMADGSKTAKDGTWYFLSSIVGNNDSYQELYYILILTIWILVSLSKDSIQALTFVKSKKY